MQSRFKQSKLFFWTVELVLTIIGVYFILQMPNIFSPILKMLSAIFYHCLLLVLSIICSINRCFLEKHRIPRVFGFIDVFGRNHFSCFNCHECSASVNGTDNSIDPELANVCR